MCFHKVVKFKSIGWDFTVWLLFLQANSRINMVLHWRLLGSCFHVSDLMKLLALLLFWQAHLILQMSKLYHGDKYWYRSQGHSCVIVHQAKVMAFGLILIYIDEGILGVFDLYLCAWEKGEGRGIWKSKVSIEDRRILMFLFSLFCYISDANLYSPFCFPMFFLSLPWQECSNIIPLISLCCSDAYLLFSLIQFFSSMYRTGFLSADYSTLSHAEVFLFMLNPWW